MKRLIHPKDIPSSLWDNKKQILHLPKPLTDEWKTILKQNNLFEKAHDSAPKGFVGGISKKDTNDHFAWRFTGSCARVVLSLLDPKNDLEDLADSYAKLFAGNKVFIADLPCGAGAASASLLSTLAVLRQHQVLPRIPLTIVILGGEISPHARAHAENILNSLRPRLLEQSISIEFSTCSWDVCDKVSTANLNRESILKSNNADSKLIMITNFSGFLEKSSKFKTAHPQLEELFRYSQDQNSSALWLEPATNAVKKNFFDKIANWFIKFFDSEKKESPESHKAIYAETVSDVQHPLKEDQKFRATLVIKQFELAKR